MSFEGVPEMLTRLRGTQSRMRDGAVTGLGLAAQLVLQVSNQRVPHEEGDLERDGATSVDDQGLQAAVSYGNTSQTAAYAVRQHEDLSYRHDNGRSAKYLERAMTETRPKVLAIIQEQVRRATS